MGGLWKEETRREGEGKVEREGCPCDDDAVDEITAGEQPSTC